LYPRLLEKDEEGLTLNAVFADVKWRVLDPLVHDDLFLGVVEGSNLRVVVVARIELSVEDVRP
jgi:hypothetical protein